MFRFTIRDVLWLTVVVGLGLGWLIDHQRQGRLNYEQDMQKWRSRAEEMRRFLESTGEVVRWNHSKDGVGIYPMYADGIPPDEKP
jgi:hypothetical protein